MVGKTKVGLCLDFPLADVHAMFLDAVRLAFDEALSSGVVDREVEMVRREAEGLPRGDVLAVRTAWQELADDGCVCILGPMISDNSVALREHIDATGKVPTLTWSGTDAQYSEWVFGLGNGSLPEEPYLMAEFLKDAGTVTVGVIREKSVPGAEYTRNFQSACEREGLEIVQIEAVGQVNGDMTAVARRLYDRRPDALAYFGFGLPAIEINKALAPLGWDPLRVMCAAFINGYLVPQWMEGFRGWVGVDQYDEDNLTGQAFLDRFEKRFGYRPTNCVATVAYDSGQLIAHGIGNAEVLSPRGVQQGLERVKVLPAASGGPGTRLTFGNYVRRAWHGIDYLVLREVDDTGKATRMRAKFRR